MNEQVPFYLQPWDTATKPPVLGNISIFDVSPIPAKVVTETKSVWENIMQASDDTTDWVWNGAKGVYENVKTGVEGIGTSINNVKDSVVGTIQSTFVLLAIAAIALIYVLGKSGVLVQAAGLRP